MNGNEKQKPNGSGAAASGAEPFTVQYQEVGADALYLPDFRVRMPDERIYSIAGIRRKGEPDEFLRRLFDEVEPTWDLPDDADVQSVTVGVFLKDLLFRYKRENISMSAMSGFRLHFYLGDELIHEVAGLTVDDLLACAMKLERENK